jgi:acetyl-CoA synthetase
MEVDTPAQTVETPETAVEDTSDKKQKVEDDPVYAPIPQASARAHVSSMEKYQEMYKQSIEDPTAFWTSIAENLYWKTPATEVGPKYNFDKSQGPIEINWMIGSQTNICYNCVDRHVDEGRGDKEAMIWESNDGDEDATFTFSELQIMVCKFANVLKSKGVGKGDRVAIYLPMIVELPVAMLACARIGAVHSVVFGGFSSEALADRLVDGTPKVIVTADGVMRGPKPIFLKDIADKANVISKENGFDCTTQIVVRRMGDKLSGEQAITWDGTRDLWWHELMEEAADTCEVEWLGPEDPLFMLYTSGSTGKPKGVLHTTAGYMLGAYTSFKYIFDARPGDVWWCTADCGWITGHTYIVYGPLTVGATSLIFEGVPTFPDAGRLWAVCDKFRVTQFYTAPTAIRALMQKGDAFVKKHKRSTLRLLGSVGEPINPEAWRWYYQVVGGSRCPVVDTWWQTETGSILITPLPGCTPLKPGSATLPFFGVEPVVLTDKGEEITETECSGILCIKKPWPSIMRTVFNNHERFESTYFEMYPGYFFTGDGCRRDKDGYYWLTGRVDDVMNCSGHRIGTAEIESALVLHTAVAEAAVVGYPHDIKGEGIYCYVTLKTGHEYTDDLKKELKQQVRNEIGAFATPDTIHWAPGLPKTRSGKIMRRILRKIAHNLPEELGDTSTLADPGVVKQLLEYGK